MATKDVGPVAAPTLEEMRRAALAVCSRATDLLDARELLACLGLIDELRPVRRSA